MYDFKCTVIKLSIYLLLTAVKRNQTLMAVLSPHENITAMHFTVLPSEICGSGPSMNTKLNLFSVQRNVLFVI